jgi:DNA-binding beta-propeller fold protein YncE
MSAAFLWNPAECEVYISPRAGWLEDCSDFCEMSEGIAEIPESFTIRDMITGGPLTSPHPAIQQTKMDHELTSPKNKQGVPVLLRALSLCLVLLPYCWAGASERAEWSILPTEELFVLKGSPGMPFRQPTDVAVDGDHRIFVMDGVNSRVAVFDEQGRYLYSFGTRGSAPGQMLMPVGIGISSSGEVFVADSGNHRIQVFSRDGGFRRSFPLITGGKGDPTDVMPAPFKNFCYVCDNDNHQVQVYDATSGEFVLAWGGKGKNLGEFRYPATLTLDHRNRVYVVDVMNARVQTFDPYGERAWEVAVWGIGSDRLFRPKGVALDSENRILVSDSFMGIIKVFLPGGDLFGFIGDSKGKRRRFATPTNIILDREERLFVVETRANQVTVCRMKE